ncbi:MAG: cobalt transport protein [Clostridia bacterium]|nr:cobalt transport protein [Clostridia bacterium]
MNAFSNLNPVVSAFYFASVAVGAMFSQSPLIKLIALVFGVACFLRLEKRIKAKELCFWLLAFFAVAASNPLFSHNGTTVLFFLNSNPITLEALLFGVDIAVMLVATVFWFKCFNSVFTEEKLLYLFGKISPKLALLLSSALRFLPHFRRKHKKIVAAQKTMGMFSSDSFADRMKSSIRSFSALMTDALEGAVETGASMKARGFGLGGRTSFSLFEFKKGDTVFLLATVALGTLFAYCSANGALGFEFYPQISFAALSAEGIIGTVAFSLLCALPFLKEGLQWLFWKLKI